MRSTRTSAPSPSVSWPGAGDPRSILTAARRIATVVLLAALPAVLVAGLFGAGLGTRSLLGDFHGDIYLAGKAILSGQNPYHPDQVAHLARLVRAGHAIPEGLPVPVYPAPALIAAAPLSLLPFSVAATLFELASIAALILAVRMLGVRDARCVGAMFLSYPVIDGLKLGAVNGFLMLGVACAWRWRHRIVSSAAAVAAVIVGKLFLWPLAVWMLLLHRWRTAAVTLLIATVTTALGWAAIGFHGLAGYPHMLGNLSTVYQAQGISTIAVFTATDVSLALSKAIAIAVTASILFLAWRHSRRPDCEQVVFGLAVMAALIASPIVWAHYLTFAFVPIALMSPGFSPLWLVPCLGWLAPTENLNGHWPGLLVYVTVEAIVIVTLLRRSPNPRIRRSPVASPL